ncbi:MAG: GYF domain-containing protein [Gemmataceae bacterium]|nr:GYF domain-containing protein [Gemmataceae bacterium]
MDAWYIARDKQKAGPFTYAQLRDLADRDELRPSAMILQHGAATWVPAGSIRGLFPNSPGNAASSGGWIADLLAKHGYAKAITAVLLLLSVITLPPILWFLVGTDRDGRPTRKDRAVAAPAQAFPYPWVTHVDRNSHAERLGILPGDELLEYEGRSLAEETTSNDVLFRAICDAKALGKRFVPLKLRRNGVLRAVYPPGGTTLGIRYNVSK